jgi:digeranylgeranylglycerophospholipid reductase
MKPAYDVVVVGAGPAGSVAARKLAEGGLDVLLIEKRQEIGAPVRCGEALGEHLTRPYIDIADRWIDARISTYSVHDAAGDAIKIPMNWTTLIVNRKVFDWELAHLAAKAGASVITRTQADGLMRDSDTWRLKIMSLGKHYEIRARLVIAADGAESQVARWTGLKTIPAMGDLYVGVQYLLGGLDIDQRNTEYHFGAEIAPGGYVWVFPKGGDTANVGIVIAANRPKTTSAQAYQDRFVAQHYPDADILGVVVGGIPATGGIRKMVADGVMVIGDAAHQADPLTAGGINLGMIAADMAAGVALKAFAQGDFSVRMLGEYETAWRTKFGTQQKGLYKLRQTMNDIPDSQFNALLRGVAGSQFPSIPLQQFLYMLLRNQNGKPFPLSVTK